MQNMKQKVDGLSLRYNSNKVVMSNIPPSVLGHLARFDDYLPIVGFEKLGEHYTIAEAKYPSEATEDGSLFPNWAKGQLMESFLIDSALRHYYAYLNGEDFDPDFGSHHMVAVAWCGCALHHYFSNYEVYSKFDDRKWKGFYFDKSTINVEANVLDVVSTTLSFLQVSTDIKRCIDISFYLILSALWLVEKDYEENGYESTFRVDAERLEKVKATNYGQAQTAQSKA